MRLVTFSSPSAEDVLARVAEYKRGGQIKPTLALVFASVKLGIETLAAGLMDCGLAVFGCSSCGEIQSEGPSVAKSKTVRERSAAVCLLEIDPRFFKVKLFRGAGKSSFVLGEEAGRWACSTFDRPAMLLMVGGLQADGEQVVRGVRTGARQEIPLHGGLAGDDALFQRTFVFGGGACADDGIVALVFDANHVELAGTATSGWTGIGSQKTVTRSVGNVVFTLDNQPALEFYKKYLDIMDEDLPQVGVEYPLLLRRDDGATVLRTVVSVDRQAKSLGFAGSVPEGASVQFAAAPGSQPLIEHVRRDLESLATKIPKSEVLLVFSCMARHLALGPLAAEEIAVAQHIWGAPAVGYFCYGEIANNSAGRCDFHNETLTITTLRSIDTAT